MANSRITGEMQAILDMQRETSKIMRETVDSFTGKIRTLDQALSIIGELADRIEEVEGILETYKRTEWMTTEQVAEYLQMDERTVRSKYYVGEIPGYQIDEHYHIRFDRAEVDAAVRGEREVATCVRQIFSAT